MRIHVCLIQENGTTKAIPRMSEELRIYLVAPSVLPAVPFGARRPAASRASERGPPVPVHARPKSP